MPSIGRTFSSVFKIHKGDIPNLEFWYPADEYKILLPITHGAVSNVYNRKITKTITREKSAGKVFSFRNVGYEEEQVKVDVILATKEEANAFTRFFTSIIKGSLNLFYYYDKLNNTGSIVRIVENSLKMGEDAGSPYSFSILMRKQSPYIGRTIYFSFGIDCGVTVYPELSPGKFCFETTLMYPVSSTTLLGVGENIMGGLGLGHDDMVTRLEQVGTDLDWSFGAGGVSHMSIVKENGDIYSSGLNTFGELGVGDTIDRNIFTFSASDCVKISSGGEFTATVGGDGKLYACGFNGYGQLGQGTYDSDPHPSFLQIGVDADWVDVKCGFSYLIARKSNNTIWGCGCDAIGQLGQGSTQLRRTSLIQIGSDTSWDKIEASNSTTYATKNNGTLWAWGNNDSGQIGDGTYVSKNIAIQIGVDTWKYIGVTGGLALESEGGDGSSTAYGIKTDGTLWGWGYNTQYQLGLGENGAHIIPTLIDSDLTWIKVGGTLRSVYGVKSNNEIYGWGWNAQYELSMGHFDPVTVPTKIVIFGRTLPSSFAILLF